MDKDRITIYFLPHGEGQPYKINLKKSTLKHIVLSVITIFLVGIITSITIFPLYLSERTLKNENLHKLKALEQQNQQLVKLLADLQQDSEVIQAYINQLSMVEQEVRESLKLGPARVSLDELLANKNPNLWSVSRGALEERIMALPEVMTRLTQEAQSTELQLVNLQDVSEVILEARRKTPDTYPVEGLIVSYFGWRKHPLWRGRDFHRGVDIRANYGQAVEVTAEGQVSDVGYRGSLGLTVTVYHRDGISTVYAHLSKREVKVGQLVSKGEIIGYVGTSGFSTGPHLHYEVRHNGVSVDPLPYLP